MKLKSRTVKLDPKDLIAVQMRHLQVAERTEREYIAFEQAKQDRALLSRLRAVKRHSIVAGRTIEALQAAGLTEFGGPSATCRYNHDRLTVAGEAKMAELAGKGGA